MAKSSLRPHFFWCHLDFQAPNGGHRPPPQESGKTTSWNIVEAIQAVEAVCNGFRKNGDSLPLQLSEQQTTRLFLSFTGLEE
jgi:hypothetical protein